MHEQVLCRACTKRMPGSAVWSTYRSAGHLHESPEQQQNDGHELQQLRHRAGRLLRLLRLLLCSPEARAAKVRLEGTIPHAACK